MLTSPRFDLSGTEPVAVRFAHWMYSDDQDDFLTLELSNDGGLTWALLGEYGHDERWRHQTLSLRSVIPITDQVQFRFTAADR